jgi:hypothetical protein
MNTNKLPQTKNELELFCKNQVLENKVRTQEIYIQFLENAFAQLRKKIDVLHNQAKRR